MTSVEPLDHNAKRTAIQKAGEEVNRALSAISDIFKNFQDDYLTLLEDNKNLRKLLKESASSRENKRKLRYPLAIISTSPEKPRKKEELISDSSRVPATHSQDFSESFGIVEATQFPRRTKQLSGNQKTQSKKSSSQLPAVSRNYENIPAGPSNLLSFQSNENELKILPLSKNKTCLRINSSARLDKQLKPVLNTASIKADVCPLGEDIKTENMKSTGLKNLQTTLDKPSAPRARLRLKTKPADEPIFEDIVLSDFEIDSMDPPLSQLEKTSVLQPEEEESKHLNIENDNLSGERSTGSPALVDNGIFNNLEIKNNPNLDETYFSQNNRIIKEPRVTENLKSRGNENPKRMCFGDVLTPVLEKNKDEINVDYDGDWDTDASLDKWASSPPHKRQLMDSFDVLPEKKKITPKFAYKVGVIRKKEERAKLQGWACKECEEYYENINLNEEELKKRMNRCSRHRGKYNERYNTPPGFWNPVFDTINSSQETVN